MSSPSVSPLRLAYANVLAYTFNTIITYSIGTGWLKERFDLPSNGELSEKYQTLVTPAGFAFAIWGIIFTAQLIFVVTALIRQLRGTGLNNTEHATKTIGYDYVWVCVAQAAWTATFTTEHIFASLICMVAILLFLAKIVKGLYYSTPSNYFLTVFPFSCHAGWILAATFVNLNVVLVWGNTSATSLLAASVASLAALLVAALVYVTKISTIHNTDTNEMVQIFDFTIPCVAVWALWGISSELASPKDSIVATFSTQQVEAIRYTALAEMSLVASVVVAKVLFGRRPTKAGTNEESTYLRADQ